MKDMQLHLDKLRANAAECQFLSDLASGRRKRELFAKLAQRHRRHAAEVEREIARVKEAGSHD